MLVTSVAEVLFPRSADFMPVLLDESHRSPNLAGAQTMTLRHFDPGLKPHLGLALLVLNMDVHPRLLSREEEQTESSLP
jgi:hypothetical protein